MLVDEREPELFGADRSGDRLDRRRHAATPRASTNPSSSPSVGIAAAHGSCVVTIAPAALASRSYPFGRQLGQEAVADGGRERVARAEAIDHVDLDAPKVHAPPGHSTAAPSGPRFRKTWRIRPPSTSVGD